MAEQDSSEKTEKATPHKLREAAKKGMAAKSQDVNSLLIMSAGLMLMYISGASLVHRSFTLSSELMSQAGSVEFEIQKIMAWASYVLGSGISILAVYVLPLMIVAVLASLLQTGPMFSFFPLKPDIQRMNPVNGFKRMFSVRSLVELVKSLLKVAAMGAVIYFTLLEYLPKYFGLMNRPPSAYIGFFISAGGVLILRLLLVLAVIALVDFVFSKWEYMKKLRMSKKEVKDEHKRFDGDPLIRQRQRELSRELLEKSKSLSNVQNADVVITNPTHYAVAVKYDRASMIAPKAVSRGAGPLALKIRELAGNHQVPVVEMPPLARRLYRNTTVGSYIRESEYLEVAAILRRIYAARRTASPGSISE